MILDSKKIAYTKIDISADESAKEEMRKLAKDPKALPPQLANGDQYCGVGLSVCLIDGLIHSNASFLSYRTTRRLKMLLKTKNWRNFSN